MSRYGFTNDTALAEVTKVHFPIKCRECDEQDVYAHHESNEYLTYFWLRCESCKAASPFHTGVEWRGVLIELKDMEVCR